MQIIPEFTEVIKIYNGQFCDVELHEERIRATVNHFFGKSIDIHFENDSIPEYLRSGVVKCRVVYSNTIHEIEFMPYSFRSINRMAVVTNNFIDYKFKYSDRSCFNNLRPIEPGFDEIVIIKNGFVTDTSFSNIVLEDEYGKLFTPTTTLLNGTKRRKLMKEGKIEEREIPESNLWKYRKIYLINAMIDIEDKLCVPTSNLIKL